ncbi:hypothetical protein LSAT2_017770 [Lamellibrachia satsuma]|nr:hypothetical protein LSAT2_017770 [Lamellibrachia satsuma]
MSVSVQLEAQSGLAKECHLSSSNLGHLQGILDVIETFPGTEQVLKRFRACRCDNARPPLIVDVICNRGNKWVKVVARKAQAVHLVWAGMRYSRDRISRWLVLFVILSEHDSTSAVSVLGLQLKPRVPMGITEISNKVTILVLVF